MFFFHIFPNFCEFSCLTVTWRTVSGSACSCGCRLTEPHGMITSSPQLFSRPGRSSCTWVITLPQGHRVHLWFDALKMDGDSIIVRDGNDSSAPKITIIKSDDYKDSIVSSGNNMYLFYKHNGHWTNGTRRGFTASYKTESRTESKRRNTYVTLSANSWSFSLRARDRPNYA